MEENLGSAPRWLTVCIVICINHNYITWTNQNSWISHSEQCLINIMQKYIYLQQVKNKTRIKLEKTDMFPEIDSKA